MFYKCILFDCDGVLVDSEVIANMHFVQGLNKIGVALTEEESLKRFTGKSKATVYEELGVSHHMRFTQEMIDDIQDAILQGLAQKVCAIDQIDQVLAILQKSKSLTFCVASSGTFEKIHQSLKRTGLSCYFDSSNIFSSQLVKQGKPAPDLFLHAAEKMNVSPHECLVIEDSLPGIQAAKAAGMRVIGFVGGSHAQSSWYREQLKEIGVELFTRHEEWVKKFNLKGV